MENFKGLKSALYIWSQNDSKILEENVNKLSEVIGTKPAVENIDRLSQSELELNHSRISSQDY